MPIVNLHAVAIGAVANSHAQRGEPFDYERIFAEADLALYEAKRGGRDRVFAAAGALIPA